MRVPHVICALVAAVTLPVAVSAVAAQDALAQLRPHARDMSAAVLAGVASCPERHTPAEGAPRAQRPEAPHQRQSLTAADAASEALAAFCLQQPGSQATSQHESGHHHLPSSTTGAHPDPQAHAGPSSRPEPRSPREPQGAQQQRPERPHHPQPNDVVQPAGEGHVTGHPAQQPPETHSPHPPQHTPPVESPYPPHIRPLTDADREAAFPDVRGHTVHDQVIHYLVLLDGLELQTAAGESRAHWDANGWVGGDLSRFWFRTSGEMTRGDLHAAGVDLLYGRAIAPWWDVVAGLRQDIRPGPARTWAAIGIQGLAPYWFEVAATAYLGSGGRTWLRVQTEYELLATNRVILRPSVALDVHGAADLERGIGAGLSTLEAGVRVRYELRRELAPYAGILWRRTFFGTADAARASGDAAGGASLVFGLRAWF